MDARWLQLKNLFREAYELPAEERAAFLREQCSDLDLRQQVEALLQVEEEDPSGSAQPVAAGHIRGVDNTETGSRVSGAAPPTEQLGALIGRYKLLQHLGDGGFGRVFMAEQQQPIRRRVALKIIKHGMDTAEVVARFEQERQALALMDHPSIARVLDGGATESGRPYFVMELVPGVPVSEYCDTHHLSIRERIELFVQIGQAVQHAHQKGVIHRDLKPTNILVSSADGRPRPKVIDFGIAKALREPLTEHTLFTKFHQMIGTPQYMSPEQAEGGEDIDTRSDVYSLGIVLYELLTGDTPFDLRRLRSAAEIQRIIREAEPPRPSTRLGSRSRARPAPRIDDSGSADAFVPFETGADGALEHVARQRRTHPPALVRQLRGELDWIVMKALEKDRARRYESAGALVGDLQRFLQHEPVLAGPPSRWYRLRKLTRRHRTGVIAGVLVLAALVAGVIGTTIGLWRARAALAREAQEARKAQEIQRVLEEALTAANPVNTTEPNLPVRELLDRTAAGLAQRLASQPEVEAAVRMTIGNAYYGLGIFDRAEPQFRRALELRTTTHAEDIAQAEAQHALGRACLAGGHLEAAEQPLRTTVTLLEGADDAKSLTTALLTLSEWELLTGAATAAKTTIERANRLAAQLAPADPHLTASALLLLGRTLEQQGDLEGAEDRYRRSLALLRALASEDVEIELELCEPLNNLGGIRRLRGDLGEGLKLANEALEIQRRRLGEEHPQLAAELANRALLERDLGRLDEAEADAQRALEIRLHRFPEDSPSVLDSLGTVGTLQFARGKFAEAAANFRRALEGRRKAVGPNDPELITELSNLADALSSLGKKQEAQALLEQALDLARRTRGNAHPETVRTVGEYAVLLLEERKFADAEPLVREALAGDRRLWGAEHPRVARDLNSLGAVLEELGRLAEAEQAYRDSLGLMRKLAPADHPDLVSAICSLCALLNATGQAAEAEPLYREALAIAEAKLTPDHAIRLRVMMGLGLALTRSGRAAEGAPLLRQVFEVRTAKLPASSPLLAHAQGAWGECLVALGEYAEAEPLLLTAHDFFASDRGASHPDTRAQVERLTRLYTNWGRPADAAKWQLRLAAPAASPMQ